MKTENYVLLTNIKHVEINRLMLHASAIVIVTGSDPDRRPDHRTDGSQRPTTWQTTWQTVRVFGPSPSWPVCDVNIPCGSGPVEYSLTKRPPPLWLPTDAIDLNHCSYDLRFRSGPPIEIAIHTLMMNGSPIVSIGFPDGTPISTVWDALEVGVQRAWDAPFFPFLHYSEPTMRPTRRR